MAYSDYCNRWIILSDVRLSGSGDDDFLFTPFFFQEREILVLEFSMPQSSAMASAYLWYFRKVLPKLGSAISGDSGAYSYLKNSVEDFPCGEKFMEKMRVAGFENITATSMTLGTVTLYEGTRPEGDFFDD